MEDFAQPLVPVLPADSRVLVAEPDPGQALALGACLARAGADATVVRTESAAQREATRPQTTFHAALLHAELLGEHLEPMVTSLRARPRPCFTVAMVPEHVAGGHRQALLLGALEVVSIPYDLPTLVDATGRAVQASLDLGARLSPSRSAPHLGWRQGPLRQPPNADVTRAIVALSREAKLSDRESAVLTLIVAGYRYIDISHELRIKPRTVKMHAANIRRKAGARTRHDLMLRIYER